MKLNFNFSILDTISDKVKISEAYQNYRVNGRPTSFGIDLNFQELNLSKSLKSSDFHALKGKIENTLL